MDTPIPWHRLFGVALTDLFGGRPWRVELEKELALRSQRLDVLIIERRPAAPPGAEADATAGLPDGLDDLAVHNVMTYKSHHQALDAWALDELLGHFVTYRKLVSIEARKSERASGDNRGPQLPERCGYRGRRPAAGGRIPALCRGDARTGQALRPDCPGSVAADALARCP